MAQTTKHQSVQIDRFFAGPGARGDQWRDLAQLAESWANGKEDRAKFDAALAEIALTEEFHAYPGAKLITALRDHAAANDPRATAKLARNITRALLTRSYRHNSGDWDAKADEEDVNTDVLPPTLARSASGRTSWTPPRCNPGRRPGSLSASAVLA